jgi:S1-C subfamily serine protease
MVNVKRIVMIAAALVLALGGAVMVNAASGTQDQTVKQQESTPGWLGVSVVDTDEGVMVRVVIPASPADVAGLRHGDIIAAVDGAAVESAEGLVELIQAHAAGDAITLTVSWRGEPRDVAVTLGERPAEGEVVSPSFGFDIMAPHAGLFQLFGVSVTATDDGLQVDEIAEDSPLAESGLQAGDVITQINGEPVLDRGGGMRGQFRSDEPLVLTVLRGGEEVEISVEFPEGQIFEMLPMEPGQEFGFGFMQPGQGFGFGPMMQPHPTQLGIGFRTLNAEIAQEAGVAVEQGALVEEVFEDTPAAAAGLQADDIITAVSGEAVDEEHTLADRLVAYEEGDVVTLTVLRGDEELSLEVTLGPRGPMFMEQGMFGGPNGMQGGFWFGPMGPHMGQQGFMGSHMGQFFMEQHPFMGGMMEMRPFMGPQGNGGMFQFDAEPTDIEPAPDGPAA